jgi:hypothetical protein
MKSYDDLNDYIRSCDDNFSEEYDDIVKKIEELIRDGYIYTSLYNDKILYSAKKNLRMEECNSMEDNIKKSILLFLIENKHTFFILQNTQKGKTKIVVIELKKWAQDKAKKVVTFYIVDNDKTLSDQSVDSIIRNFENINVKIFSLNSNTKVTFDIIKTYIDAYAGDMDGDYPMPIITLLCNNKQCEKMLNLLAHIEKKVSINNSRLRYAMIWDEADKTYSQLRDKPFTINNSTTTVKRFTVENTIALYRLGFVTATDGNLLDEDYPECSNAYLYPVEISLEDQKNYRALHHEESITHIMPFTSKHTYNSYAIDILENNNEHFTTPIVLPTGEIYYRKIIAISNHTTKDMDELAKYCISNNNYYAIVFNGNCGTSIKIYSYENDTRVYKTKGCKFNELLYYLYKKLNLNDKPIIIIGNKKIDRGVGFHYCPNNDDEIIIEYVPKLGKLICKNRDGLVWTDTILGRIDNIASAVQKAGRGSGNIGNSPQYSGTSHYWTDKETEQKIRRHNTIVDESNTKIGYSIGMAVSEAKNNLPEIKAEKPKKENNCLEAPVSFKTPKQAFDYLKTIPGYENIKKEASSFVEKDGYIISTRLNAHYNKDKEELDANDRLTIDIFRKIPLGMCISAGWNKYMLYPVYKDMSDKTVVYYLRYYKKPNISE